MHIYIFKPLFLHAGKKGENTKKDFTSTELSTKPETHKPLFLSYMTAKVSLSQAN